MKFLKAIWNRIRLFFNMAADKIDDKVGNAELGLEDAAKEAKDHKSEIAGLMAANKGIERELIKAKAEYEKFDGLAKKFAAQGNESMTKQCIDTRARAQGLVTQHTKTFESNKRLIADLTQRVRKHEANIEDGKAKLSGLKASHSSATLRKKMVNSKLSGDGLGAVDALEDLVEDMTDFADSLEDIHTSPSDRLDEQIAAMTMSEDPLMAAAREAAEAKVETTRTTPSLEQVRSPDPIGSSNNDNSSSSSSSSYDSGGGGGSSDCGGGSDD